MITLEAFLTLEKMKKIQKKPKDKISKKPEKSNLSNLDKPRTNNINTFLYFIIRK